MSRLSDYDTRGLNKMMNELAYINVFEGSDTPEAMKMRAAFGQSGAGSVRAAHIVSYARAVGLLLATGVMGRESATVRDKSVCCPAKPDLVPSIQRRVFFSSPPSPSSLAAAQHPARDAGRDGQEAYA